VKQGIGLPGRLCESNILGLLLLLGGASGWAQETSAPVTPPADSMTAAIHELQEQVRELRAAVVEVRSEAAQYRAETAELRRELQATRTDLAASGAPQSGAYPPVSANGANPPSTNPGSNPAPSPAPVPAQAGSPEDRVAALEESSQVLNSKVDDQYQTKVESASKYKVRLSGIVLLNLFDTRGGTDNQDFPTWATGQGPGDPNGNFGASLRQSELGLEVFGPRLAGAKTSGNLQFDFSGGFPTTFNGVNYGLVRLRIANLRMDWDHTSIVAGQDNAFISPLAPTSFASLAVPALGYAGNLWGWIPQLRVEHRYDISDRQQVTLQGGIFDNLVGEPPDDAFLRLPSAGERSSQPAFGARVAWTADILGRPMTLGTAGYYSRQDWGFDHHVDGWGGMADWDIPVASRVSLSGEFYRGRAIGGLGGGFGRSVFFSTQSVGPTTQIRALNSIGGWSQLKFKASSKLEFNGAFGLDNPFAQDLRAFPSPHSYFVASLAQNRSALVNFIYRPRSNLVFSGEYRHLRTFFVDSNSNSAEQVNMIMGILF
jgi:hypothetical protein